MIDNLLPSQWPEDVLEAARRFRQGFVVEKPPFFYARSDAYPIWELSMADEPEAQGEEIVDVDPADRPPWGLITTQTCDLYEEGGRPKQPWFSVAPVYDYRPQLREGQLAQLRRGQMSHLVLLTAAWLPAGAWVADLRIEVPLEKGWLVGRTPLGGFASADEYNTLSIRLATRRGRPALSTAITEHIVKPLRAWLRGAGARHRDEIDSLRLLVPGTWRRVPSLPWWWSRPRTRCWRRRRRRGSSLRRRLLTQRPRRA